MQLAKGAAMVFLAITPRLFVDAAKSTTTTSTKTIFLPSRSTGSASNIYASVITSDSSKTEYLLACQTAFKSPYKCDGEFTGVTVTYSASSEMDVAFGAATYNCTIGKTSAVCATKTASSADERTTTLGSSASSAWMTAITILDAKKKTTTKKDTATSSTTSSSGSSICKRSTNNKSSNSKSNKNSKKKNGKDKCSGAPTKWGISVVGVVGAGLVFALGL